MDREDTIGVGRINNNDQYGIDYFLKFRKPEDVSFFAIDKRGGPKIENFKFFKLAHETGLDPDSFVVCGFSYWEDQVTRQMYFKRGDRDEDRDHPYETHGERIIHLIQLALKSGWEVYYTSQDTIGYLQMWQSFGNIFSQSDHNCELK